MLKVDTEKYQELAQKYKITALPTVVSCHSCRSDRIAASLGRVPDHSSARLLYADAAIPQLAFKNGNVVAKMVGAAPEAGVKEFLAKAKSA